MANKGKQDKTATVVKQGIAVGRDKTVIVPEEVEALARLHCNYKEMADFFGVNVETLKYNFSDIILKARSETKQALRKAQIKLALGGNATMLIWLGKNILDQSEQPGNKEEIDKILPWED